jgi:hypothetical protein
VFASMALWMDGRFSIDTNECHLASIFICCGSGCGGKFKSLGIWPRSFDLESIRHLSVLCLSAEKRACV